MVYGVAMLPREVRDEKGGVENVAQDVVEKPRVGKGAVSTFIKRTGDG
jgi:hypothetical protein